jgi:hypothetical protein
VTDQIQPTVPQPATPDLAPAVPPRAPLPEYRPWRRPRTYIVFALAMSAAGFLMICPLPYAILMGWFALGLGIPALLLGKKEIAEFPAAASHGFIKWGCRLGLLSIIIGPLTAIVWTVLLFAIGFGFGHGFRF